mmetsp:Transcript_13610/g.42970  ORF Transcript_13610/g.42970 Transcript_13610/m.42970 type:complete len:226 (+) Transcript_13610:29-706(+)
MRVVFAVALLARSRAFYVEPRARAVRVAASGDEEPESGLREAWTSGVEFGKTLATRFTSPRIDDEGLVITDALAAGIVAPGLEAIVCVVTGLPLPVWATVLGPRRLLAPVALRGVTLAGCWFGGALAGRLYERAAFDFPPPTGSSDRYAVTASRVAQSGCFAVALLIFSTQLQTLLTLGPVQFGDSPETDFQLLRLTDDLLRDIATEALVLAPWRLARTYLSRLD